MNPQPVGHKARPTKTDRTRHVGRVLWAKCQVMQNTFRLNKCQRTVYCRRPMRLPAARKLTAKGCVWRVGLW